MSHKWVNTSILVIVVVSIFVVIYQPWKTTEITNNKKVISNTYNDIEITTGNAKVEIIPTTNTETTVSVSGKTQKRSKLTFEADVRGDTLSVQLKRKRGAFLWFGPFSNMTLTVSVPEKQYATIEVDSKNGRIDLENILAKTIRLETKNGRITLDHIQADTIDLKTSNGQIELSSISSNMVNAKSSNGKMTLDQVTGKINGKTSNGRISLVTNSLDQAIELTTSNGRIEIASSKEPTNTVIEVKTSNGKINVLGNSNTLTTFGNGEHLIKLRTSNGSVNVIKQ